ncbi:hypothetical protein RF11_16208 [Thelohanellus kitauei]|uniref:Uncharacterized protein n=1 Tax=Thelohanellus kitauei TaxID=669202 RepID=A0A0C2MDZ9_THEKT|nr:hypothetical protein RF11_16208 [Thelohanellus kitauei]
MHHLTLPELLEIIRETITPISMKFLSNERCCQRWLSHVTILREDIEDFELPENEARVYMCEEMARRISREEKNVLQSFLKYTINRDPTFTNRLYVQTYRTYLDEAVVNCAFRNSNLMTTERFLACCDMIQPKLVVRDDIIVSQQDNDWPDRINRCRILESSFNDCIKESFYAETQQHFKKRYFLIL